MSVSFSPGAPSVSVGEGLLERRVGRGVERMVIDRLAGERAQPIVAPAVELEHVELLLQEIDERQEALALQPVLVEIVGRPVRGRDHDDAALEQLLEEPPEDHRVGDVGDLELVEAEQRRLAGDRLGDRRDRIALDELRPA